MAAALAEALRTEEGDFVVTAEPSEIANEVTVTCFKLSRQVWHKSVRIDQLSDLQIVKGAGLNNDQVHLIDRGGHVERKLKLSDGNYV